MEKRLIKDGDIILDGTLPRYEKEVNVYLVQLSEKEYCKAKKIFKESKDERRIRSV